MPKVSAEAASSFAERMKAIFKSPFEREGRRLGARVGGDF
jgi:hypothetical protein